jgi:DnaJ family protein C protein 28
MVTSMNLDAIGKIAEQKILEAIEEGQFDNLPGKGKPIVFDDDLMTPPHLRLANKILKNANVLPDWIQVQQDIAAERQTAASHRERVVHENHTKQARVSALPADHPELRRYAEWHARSRAAYLRHLKSLNTSILNFSILAPSTAQPFRSYKIDAEMAAFDAEFPSFAPHASVPAPTAETADETGGLKTIARMRYQGKTR